MFSEEKYQLSEMLLNINRIYLETWQWVHVVLILCLYFQFWRPYTGQDSEWSKLWGNGRLYTRHQW